VALPAWPRKCGEPSGEYLPFRILLRLPEFAARVRRVTGRFLWTEHSRVKNFKHRISIGVSWRSAQQPSLLHPRHRKRR